jgi:hypothetical protein
MTYPPLPLTYTHTDNTTDVRRGCPAEQTSFISQNEGYAHLSVQPQDPTVVYISHSKHSIHIACLIMKTFAEAGILSRCTCSYADDQGMCITIIDTIIQNTYTNDAYTNEI